MLFLIGKVIIADTGFDVLTHAVEGYTASNAGTIPDLLAQDAFRTAFALPSSGIHSNGFSLVRKVFDVEHADLNVYSDELGRTLGEALLEPTRIYVKPVLRCLEAANVKGISHITGGGFFENIPRCLPEGLTAKIDKGAIRTLPIFSMLQSKGNIPEHDMFNTYNMGVGMTVIVSKETADAAIAALDCGAYVIGEVVSGEERVTLC